MMHDNVTWLDRIMQFSEVQ